MKKNYQKPDLEVIGFKMEDVITTSGANNGIIGPPDFGATAPDFTWGNEEDGWGSMPFTIR